MRTAVFDLDGTLADTAADLIAAANAALTSGGYGTRLDDVSDAGVAFAGGRAMLRSGLLRADPEMPDKQITEISDSLFQVLLDSYRDNIAVHTRLYEGVVPALLDLRSRGWLLAVCTNKPLYLALTLLGELRIAGHFQSILGADSLPVRKPDPQHLLETIVQAGGDPYRSVLVGDTTNDREAARSAGVPSILVAFGPEGPGVERMKPERLLYHYRDLPDMLETMFPA